MSEGEGADRQRGTVKGRAGGGQKKGKVGVLKTKGDTKWSWNFFLMLRSRKAAEWMEERVSGVKGRGGGVDKAARLWRTKRT